MIITVKEAESRNQKCSIGKSIMNMVIIYCRGIVSPAIDKTSPLVRREMEVSSF